jgi:hypothetical protein
VATSSVTETLQEAQTLIPKLRRCLVIDPGRASKRLLAVPALLAGVFLPSLCHATLVGPGDLAFIRFNGDGGLTFDDFAIVLLADADPGQLVSFRNGDYLEDLGKFGSGKHFVWEVTDALTAGTVVNFVDLARSKPATSSEGIIQNGVNNTMPLSTNGETIHAYLGTDAIVPGNFLAGISTESTTAFDGTGLVLGQTAVYIPSIGGDLVYEAHYVGDRSNQSAFSDYLPLVGDVNANWERRISTGSVSPFDSSNFTLQNGATVPESPTVVILGVLMLLACLSLGARWRRQPAVALAD